VIADLDHVDDALDAEHLARHGRLEPHWPAPVSVAMRGAVPQAYYNMKAGTKRIATETGAASGAQVSPWRARFRHRVVIYMVKVSYHQKPIARCSCRPGARRSSQPSDHNLRPQDPQRAPGFPGSLGMAISEAIEDTVTTPNTKYALGSVLNHVCLHQTVIGQNRSSRWKLAGEEPDVVIGCAGGGSNFSASPSLRPRKLKQGAKTRIMAVEPASCPSSPRASSATTSATPP